MSHNTESLREFLGGHRGQLSRGVAEAMRAEREALNARNMLHSGTASHATLTGAATALDQGTRELAEDLATFDLPLREWDQAEEAAAELVASVEKEVWDALQRFYGDITALRPQFDEAVANARRQLQVGCNRGRRAARDRRRTIVWDLVKLLVGAILGYAVGRLT